MCFNASLKSYIFPFKLPKGYWHDAWLGLHAAANEGLFFLEESLIEYRVHGKQQVGVSDVVSDEIVSKSNPNDVNKSQFFYTLRKQYAAKRILYPNNLVLVLKLFLSLKMVLNILGVIFIQNQKIIIDKR